MIESPRVRRMANLNLIFIRREKDERHYFQKNIDIGYYAKELIEPLSCLIISIACLFINILYIFIPIGQIIMAFFVRYVSRDELIEMGMKNDSYFKEGYTTINSIKKLKEKIKQEKEEET